VRRQAREESLAVVTHSPPERGPDADFDQTRKLVSPIETALVPSLTLIELSGKIDKRLARLALDLGFAIILYVALVMIVVPAYLLAAMHGASKRLQNPIPRRNEKMKMRGEKAQPPVFSERPSPAAIETELPIFSGRLSPAINGAESPSFSVDLHFRVTCTVKPSLPSDMRLEAVAKGIGVDVKSLQRWVDDQKRFAAGEDRRQAMYKILADLEKPPEMRQQRLNFAS